MSKEIVEAVHVLEREKGISAERLMLALEDALLSAYKKTQDAAKYARALADEAPEVLGLGERALGAGRGDLERVLGEQVGQVLGDALAGGQVDAARTVDREPQPVAADAVDRDQLDVRLGGRESLLDGLLYLVCALVQVRIWAKKRWAAKPTSRCGDARRR